MRAPTVPAKPQFGGTAFGGIAFNTPARNTTGFQIALVIRAGVAANPGQNGHLYLEIAPPQAAPNEATAPSSGWLTCDYVACRNNQAAGTGGAGSVAADNGAMIGCGRGLQAWVPPGWWYRLRTQTVTNYAAPTYILDGATPGFFQTFA